VGLDRSVVSKIISNVQMHNINNVDKRSTLKPEDYPAALELVSNTKSCYANIFTEKVEDTNNVTSNIICIPNLRVKIPKSEYPRIVERVRAKRRRRLLSS
jgi:hypothetical protein